MTNETTPSSNSGFLPGDRVTRGTVARWSESAGWVDRDGLPLPDTMFVVGYTTTVRRWVDNKPIDITEHPLPDPEQLNATIPVEQWERGLDGNPRKPWSRTYFIYMVDLKTGALYTYANSTFGCMLCFTNLEEQVALMRMLRGEHVLPIVHLERRPMKTNFGMKTRPHLEIKEWRAIGGSPLVSQSLPLQLPRPATAAAPAAAPSAASPPAAPVVPVASPSAAAPATPSASTVLDNTKPVKPVTVAELIADELPPWA
jgi:hypothetical protein